MDSEKKRFKWVKLNTRILFFLGIAFIFIAGMINIGSLYVAEKFWQSLAVFASSVFSSGGIALLVIALVESSHLRSILKEATKIIVDKSSERMEEATKTIVNKSSQRIEEKLRETFSIVQNSQEHGLIDIYAPRQDQDKGKATKEEIGREIEAAEYVKLLSISGLDFFRLPKGAQAGSGEHYKKIMGRLNKIREKDSGSHIDLKIDALLMNPVSEAAEIRNEVEEIPGIPGDIEKDIVVAMEGIKRLNNANDKEFVHVRFFSEQPQTGFVLTNNCVFIEPYHSAPVIEFCDRLLNDGLSSSAKDSQCTGGRIPVLKFAKNSNMYVAMEVFFDYLWEKNHDTEHK